jgi:hypothetical protein
MFDKGIIRSMMFLLVILIVACMLAQETRDGFLGQPKLNKKVLNIDNQNVIRKAENVAKAAAKKAAPQTPQRQAPTTPQQQTSQQRPPPAPPQQQQRPPPTTPQQRPPALMQTAPVPLVQK